MEGGARRRRLSAVAPRCEETALGFAGSYDKENRRERRRMGALFTVLRDGLRELWLTGCRWRRRDHDERSSGSPVKTVLRSVAGLRHPRSGCR
ncbi:hypothetical protein GUJ93_ZPchr0010g9611 [Zizania palustris]|uniref:Uncharacterized protein n=1 Tax=Zizania palustris TaxID=103762 RepID=A0A8J5WAP0_ZIZPA|nr:hypothetical protein GUJ93_ZPchr0010g9611 [Zizania palustris]